MRLAMWLLSRFGVPQRNEALVGDLIEERRAGRSAFWVWGQTAVAIADTVVRDLRDHWALALRAAGTGWVASFLCARIFAAIPWLDWWLRIPNRARFDIVALFYFVLGVLLVWPLALGWLVAETHRPQRAAMVVAFAASVALCAPWVPVQCLPLVQTDSKFWIGCANVAGVLIGGLLPGLRGRRTA